MKAPNGENLHAGPYLGARLIRRTRKLAQSAVCLIEKYGDSWHVRL